MGLQIFLTFISLMATIWLIIKAFEDKFYSQDRWCWVVLGASWWVSFLGAAISSHFVIWNYL